MIEKTVNNWNNNIINAFKNVDCLVSGLAIPIIRKDVDSEQREVYFPALVSNNGECADVFVDDNYKFGIYHKLLNLDYQRKSTQTYGDRERISVSAELMMICWGWISFANALEMERKMYALSPKEVNLISSNFDRKQVFSSEFSGVPFFLAPEEFLFSIKYRVHFSVDKNCIQ